MPDSMRALVRDVTECMERHGDSEWYPDAYRVFSVQYLALLLRAFLSQGPRHLCHHGVGLLAFRLRIPFFSLSPHTGELLVSKKVNVGRTRQQPLNLGTSAFITPSLPYLSN